MAEVEADRDAKTVADLCQRFEEEHLTKVRPVTKRDYQAIIRREIKPELKHLKVAEVSYSDIDGLHRKINMDNKALICQSSTRRLSETAVDRRPASKTAYGRRECMRSLPE